MKRIQFHTLIASFFALLTSHAKAAEITDIPQIGPHHRIVTFEKNENPQNIMEIFTRLDDSCRFVSDAKNSERPVFDFYWLMDRVRYKPVHPLIKRGINKRLEVDTTKNDRTGVDAFSIRLGDLKELEHDLSDPIVHVRSERSGSSCEIEAIMKLGPSNANITLRLDRIYTESRKSLLPPFRKVTSVTLSGSHLQTGEKIVRTYRSRS